MRIFNRPVTQRPLDDILASVQRRQPPYEAQAEELIASAQLQKLQARPASALGAYDRLKMRLLQHQAQTGERALSTTSKAGYKTDIYFDKTEPAGCIRVETDGVNKQGLMEFFEAEHHPPKSGIRYTAKAIERETKHVPVFNKSWQVKLVDKLAEKGTIPPHWKENWTSIQTNHFSNPGTPEDPTLKEYFRHAWITQRSSDELTKVILNPKDPKDPLSLNVTA
jgi:hypothetical protein